jgi:hypothetical protein
VRGLLLILSPEFQREDQQTHGRERSQARALSLLMLLTTLSLLTPLTLIPSS